MPTQLTVSMLNYQCVVYSKINLQQAGYYCDLGKNEFISHIEIILSAKHLAHFDVYTSLDAKNWHSIYSKTSKGYVFLVQPDNATAGFTGRFIYIKSNCIEIINKLIIFINTEIIAFRNIGLKDSPHISSTVKNAIKEQSYERSELDLVLEYVAPDDVILELGGSLGAMSSVILKNNKIKNYYCVEANPQMIELMKVNHYLNNIPNINIINGVMTLHPKVESLNFYLSKNCYASSLSQINNPIGTIKVKTYCFQSFITQHKPNFIICDIEHGEYELFKPPCDLSFIDKICIEIHASIEQDKIYTFFSQQGFTPIFSPEELSPKSHVNFFSRK